MTFVAAARSSPARPSRGKQTAREFGKAKAQWLSDHQEPAQASMELKAVDFIGLEPLAMPKRQLQRE